MLDFEDLQLFARDLLRDHAEVREAGSCASAISSGFTSDDGVERPLDVGGGELATVMEPDVVTEMEDVGLRIGYFPALGNPWAELEVLVAMNKSVEEELSIVRTGRRFRREGRGL